MTSAAADSYTEPTWDEAVAKPATSVQERAHSWLTEKAGEEIEETFKIDLDNKKQAAAFWAGFLMSWRFRMAFQASPENQKARAASAKASAKAKDDDEDDEDEAPKPKAKAKKAKKAEPEPAPKAKKSKTKPAPVEDEEDEDDEDEAPKPKAASKASKGRRGKSAF